MASEPAEKSIDKRLANLRPFQPGQSGNPKGRQKGSRNQLAESFLADLHAKWEERGIEAMDKMASDDPSGFVRVVASILPKELVLKNEMDEVSDEQLAAFLDAARTAIGLHSEGASGSGAADSPQQAKALQTLQ